MRKIVSNIEVSLILALCFKFYSYCGESRKCQFKWHCFQNDDDDSDWFYEMVN